MRKLQKKPLACPENNGRTGRDYSERAGKGPDFTYDQLLGCFRFSRRRENRNISHGLSCQLKILVHTALEKFETVINGLVPGVNEGFGFLGKRLGSLFNQRLRLFLD